MDVRDKKPAILCLHGGGTSAAIYKIQTLRLRHALSSHFDFVFVNAPFITEPGPGVLPFFEGAGPFYSWERPTDGGKIPKESTAVVEEAIKRQCLEMRQPFVAILGFSQGAKLGAALMMEQQKQQNQGGKFVEGPKFGVFLMGVCPKVEGIEKLRLPTIHVIGSHDVYRAESKRLWLECCQRDKAIYIELPVGHQVPLMKAHTKDLVTEILGAYCRSLMS
jgi:hypothetical protein